MQTGGIGLSGFPGRRGEWEVSKREAFMRRFQYEITRHTSEKVDELVYFCSEKGDCSLKQISADQTEMLGLMLNERGSQGWELVQLVFGKEGFLAIWKREES